VETVALSNLSVYQKNSSRQKVASYFNKKHGVYVNSGSAANLIGLAVYEFPKGSEIITPACTFSTCVAPMEQLGLKPVFVDVELNQYVPSLDAILGAITENTKMIFIPNLVGSKIDWATLRDRLHNEAKRPDIVLFEDSCDCMTSTAASDISVISFYASHVITGCGMGGMVMFNDPELEKRAYMYRDWGRIGNNSEDVAERFKHDVDGIEYDFKFLYGVQGYNLKACEVFLSSFWVRSSLWRWMTSSTEGESVNFFFEQASNVGILKR